MAKNYKLSYTAREIDERLGMSTITGVGLPTAATEGAVGCLYMDISTGEVYKRVAVDADHSYTWAIADNNSTHEKYFTITDDGIVSLKPEYRGAPVQGTGVLTGGEIPEAAISDNDEGAVGSKNACLPAVLLIPETITGIPVVGIADGAFHTNLRLESITLPVTITTIPYKCFSHCSNLREVNNVEQITVLGAGALQRTHVERISFPNLLEMGAIAFERCAHLKFVDMGKVSSIPDFTFYSCTSLFEIANSGTVTTIGKMAFHKTTQLASYNFISDSITSIGIGAFTLSRVQYDWNSLTNCNFGVMATSKQINPTDIWSGCVSVNHENPLPTLFSQYDKRWENRGCYYYTTDSSTTLKTYLSSCIVFSIIHAYCGLHNLKLETVADWEDIIAKKGVSTLEDFPSAYGEVPTFIQSLGCEATAYPTITAETLQATYDAIADGKYVIITIPNGNPAYGDNNKSSDDYKVMTGHAGVIYGCRQDGKLLVADSTQAYWDDDTIGTTYALPYENLLTPSYDTTPSRYPALIVMSLEDTQ